MQQNSHTIKDTGLPVTVGAQTYDCFPPWLHTLQATATNMYIVPTVTCNHDQIYTWLGIVR